MIPLLPELTSPTNIAKPEFGPPAAKLRFGDLQKQSDGLPGETLAFDDLIAAAMGAPEPALRSGERGFENAEDARIAPDLKALPGKGLPDLGKAMPDIAELAVAPRAATLRPEDLSATQPDARIAEDDARPPTAVVSGDGPEQLQGDVAGAGFDSPTNQPRRALELEPAKPQNDARAPKSGVEQTDPDLDQEPRTPDAPTFAAPASDAQKADPVSLSPAAPKEPVLVAAPQAVKNMRANQPVPTEDRPRLPKIARSEAPLSAPTQVAPDELELEPALRDAPKIARGSAAPSPQPAVPSQPAGASASAAQSPLPTADTAQTAQLQTGQPQPAPPPATPSFQAAPSALSPPSDVRAEARVIPQIEQAIDALNDAREAGRSSRPEVLLRHGEFGLVSMRLDAAGGDLRATLASRDPGFVPAIQAALSERALAASSETASSHNQQRGQEQGQSGANSQTFSGNNGGFGQNYGSSPGSSQGPPQPRMAQQDNTQPGSDESDRSGAAELPSPIAGGGGVFA